MADDSAQRLLDVIDDPSALDEFLGTLTSDGVPDNVVESLARSLAAEFDSPNENLFDSSSANLTDISHSAVPFDFDPCPPNPTNELQNTFTPNRNEADLNDFHESQYPTSNQTSYSNQLESGTTETSLTPDPHSFKGTENAHSESSSLSSPVDRTRPTISNNSTTPGPPPPTTTNPTNNGPTHVYVTTNTPEQTQYASLGQLVQAQQNAAVLAGMNQQLSLNAQPGASFIIDPTTGQPMMVAGGNTFGTTNLLMAGVQPTYTMLPTQGSIFSNTITMQPQLQAIKTSHGTTTGFIQASTGQSTNTTPTLQPTKAKNPPHLLPKPNNGNSNTVNSDHGQMEVSGGNGSGGNNVVVTSSAGSITMTTESLSQILQQQQATVSPAPSFAIGAGGQVVQVSGMQTLNSISGSQIFMNQFGQQMLVPTAMSPGVQFIVRQQPQPQVLTIQAPTATSQATTTNGKLVRFVSAAPQVPQVTQNSIQLQQIQTAQGTTWVAVRSGPVQQQPVVSIQPPSSPAPVVVAKTPTPPPPPPTPPQPPPVVQLTTDTISACIQSVIERLKSPSPPLTTTVQSVQYSSPISSLGGDKSTPATPDPAPPPKKKPKYSKKKKVIVTLDLEQLLKQSGIMDEDLEDDGTGFTFGDFFSPSSVGEEGGTTSQESTQHNGIHNNNNNNNNQKDFFKPVANGTGGGIPFTSTVPTHSHILKPSTKSKQRKSVPGGKVKSSPSLSPPPKSPPKKSKKKPSPGGTTTNTEGMNSNPVTPKSPPKKKKGKKSPTVEIKEEVVSNSNFIPTTPTTPNKKKGKGKKKMEDVKIKVEEGHEMSVQVPLPPQPQQQTPPRRIVQTIQLTPQNQTLLRNIQAQIQKLLSLTTRNEVEENALQKLINLQSEVIKTGTPVPNPPHLQTLNSGGGRTTPLATSPQVKLGNGIGGLVNGVLGVGEKGTLGGGVGAKGVTNKGTIQSPLSSPSNQPPPLVLNKSCTNAKLLIRSLSSTGGNPTEETPSGTEGQKILLLSQGTIPTTVEEFNTPPPSTDEMTSSAVTILPTTTLSTSMSGIHSNQGISNGVYYNSPYEPPLSAIDEKKLEEQLMARLEQEEETRIQWRRDEFEKRLKMDHSSFVSPDYQTKFQSLKDATGRLMSFHVGRDTAEITFQEFDEDFAETSCQLLNKFSGMVAKYRALLLKESMKDVECAERVMLERMFVGEEKLKLEHDRGLVQQGEVLELPPAPPSWVPRIRQMVETEVKEMERDSLANQQVQSAIDSIMSFEPNGTNTPSLDDKEKIEYDAFGVPIPSGNYNSLNSSSADIDEAVRSILL